MSERKPSPGGSRKTKDQLLQGIPDRFFNEEIDLHAKRREDVAREVSALIDRHYSEGGTVKVVCGTGTGAIKSEVLKFLKSLPTADYPYEIDSYEDLGPVVFIHLE